MAETTLYNPASLRDDELISSFVVRTKTFDKIFKDIKGSDMRYPEKHYLIQGQRGMGKTTLLLRLKYEVERTESLKDWLIPVFFNEETYDVNSLSSLWEKLLKFLDDHFDTGGEFYDYTEKFVDEDDYERLCFNFLIEKLRERGKKLILFYDNFGELFLDNLKEKEKRRLREILIDCNEIRIIGASAVVINDLHDYSQPFFEFFQIIHLDGLSKEETYDLIAKLQEDCSQDKRIDLKKHKAKIETLAVLTGGVIRTIMMLYQVLLDDPNGKALQDLEKVLDKVTPLYKHRIEDLPLQQRRIVDVIAKKWDAVSAKDIAAEIREDGKKMQTKLVSAQLAQLEKNNVVEKKATTTKNNYYQLKERFFNIWYLMRNGDRRDKKRVAWLTKFLEMWYDDDDSFDAFVKNHIHSLRSGNYVPSSALLLAEALVSSDKFDIEKVDGVVNETSSVLKEEQRQYLPDMKNKRIAVAIKHFESGSVLEAIEALLGVQNKDTPVYLLMALFYYADKQVLQAKEVLRNVKIIHESNLEFFTSICIDLKFYNYFFQVIEQNKGLNIKYLEESIGDVYAEQGMLDLALDHYNMAFDAGNITIWSKLKNVYSIKEDLVGIEELLLKAFDKGQIEKAIILDFYALKLKDYDKLKRWMEESDKDGNYYLYLALIEMDIISNDDEIVSSEMLSYLEKSIDLFCLEKNKNANLVMSSFILMLYHTKISKNRKEVIDILKKVDSLISFPGGNGYNVLKAFALVWNSEYNNPIISQILERFTVVEIEDSELFSDLLLLLLAKHQYHFLFSQFEKNTKLKELFKPIYYALMTLMEEEMPNEIIKMGEELRGPVEEILQKVNQMKIDYK